jgi:precorrin-3B C17-methyltransferase
LAAARNPRRIAKRLAAAADGDFVIAFYNPASSARPHQIGLAFDLLRARKAPETVVLLIRNAAMPDVRVVITTLAEVDAGMVDMRTLVIIGASTTRLLARDGKTPWVYTPRAERDKL